LEDYATDGLRTLLLVEKVISDDEYDIWNEKYKEASLAIRNREELVDEVCTELENNFNLIGSTAIEDKL
jgi:magnesium-transporting ATPase (P-type)